SPDDRASLIGANVGLDTPFAAIDRLTRVGSGIRAATGTFDLDDAGAVVRQHHCGDSGGHAPARVDHYESVEWTSHCTLLLSHGAASCAARVSVWQSDSPSRRWRARRPGFVSRTRAEVWP